MRAFCSLLNRWWQAQRCRPHIFTSVIRFVLFVQGRQQDVALTGVGVSLHFFTGIYAWQKKN
jgi:hypothetical protein